MFIKRKNYEKLENDVVSLRAVVSNIETELFGKGSYLGLTQKVNSLQRYLNVSYVNAGGKLQAVPEKGEDNAY